MKAYPSMPTPMVGASRVAFWSAMAVKPVVLLMGPPGWLPARVPAGDPVIARRARELKRIDGPWRPPAVSARRGRRLRRTGAAVEVVEQRARHHAHADHEALLVHVELGRVPAGGDAARGVADAEEVIEPRRDLLEIGEVLGGHEGPDGEHVLVAEDAAQRGQRLLDEARLVIGDAGDLLEARLEGGAVGRGD